MQRRGTDLPVTGIDKDILFGYFGGEITLQPGTRSLVPSSPTLASRASRRWSATQERAFESSILHVERDEGPTDNASPSPDPSNCSWPGP